MGIFQKIRKNSFINLLVREFLKLIQLKQNKLSLSLINKWPTSGILNCQFEQFSFKYYNECDDGIIHFFYYNLPYVERADLRLFLKLSESSTTIIDIGANTGLYSVLSSKANQLSSIYSFEPNKINFDRLNVNLNLNNATNINSYQIAIGNYDGEIKLAVPKNNTITDVSSVNIEFSEKIYPEVEWETQLVDVNKLDTFTSRNNLRVDLVKCDVETFEMAVFEGAQQVLEIDRPTIIFECFLDEERKSFFNNLLEKHKYYVYLILEQGIVHTSEGFLDSGCGLNYLITPKKPTQTFISYNDSSLIVNALLERPILI
jgi:FkbM family methyltransferase